MAAESQKKYAPKKDKYSRKRGAPQLMDISCSKCCTYVLSYQKDGPGSLLRLYLDRIYAPTTFAEWRTYSSIKEVPNLVCPHCGNQLGIPMIYQPENRLAIRLRRGTFKKESSDGATRQV